MRRDGLLGIDMGPRLGLTHAGAFGYDEFIPWACGADGSAPDWQSGGQGFDPPQVHSSRLRRSPIHVMGTRPKLVGLYPGSRLLTKRPR